MTKNNIPDINDALPIPWFWTETDLTTQLRREINDNHILSSKNVKSIARRQDTDDVLYEIENDEYKYAVVHLTWAQQKLNNIEYPRTKLYKTWSELIDNRINVDHKYFQE